MNRADRLRHRWIRRIVHVLTAVIAVVAVAAVSAPAAHADVQYPVAWTGIGIYPRTAPSMDAPHAGPVLTDGTMVTFVCEQQGQAVHNGHMNVDVWVKISSGGWLPTAFINTQVDGWTPGVPRCGTSNPAPAPQNKPQVATCGTSTYVENIQTVDMAGSDFQIVVTPTQAARDKRANRDVVVEMWHKVQSCVPGLYDALADSIWQQLECHQEHSNMGGGPTWDLESYRTPLAFPNSATYLATHCLNRLWPNGPENGEPGTDSVARAPLHVA